MTILILEKASFAVVCKQKEHSEITNDMGNLLTEITVRWMDRGTMRACYPRRIEEEITPVQGL